MAADTSKNQAQDVMPGFGTAGNDGGSSVNLAVTLTGLSTGTSTLTTGTSAGTANKGYVRVFFTAPTSSGTFTNLIVTVTDGTTTQAIYASTFGTIVAAGDTMSLLIPWESDLAVNSATALLTFAGGGTVSGTIELCGNVGAPPTGTGTL